MKPFGSHTAQPGGSRHIRPRSVLALADKEGRQILRDPSSLIIAFVLPLVLLFLFGWGISLDPTRIPLGL
ncbi:MAG: hypothetical protein GYA33_16095, partial [Thermogutta sp.]|nr:hypothetical protein [Thermogutta sp.]